MNEDYRRECNKMSIHYRRESRYKIFKNSYELEYLNELPDNYRCAKTSDRVLCIRELKYFMDIIVCGSK